MNQTNTSPKAPKTTGQFYSGAIEKFFGSDMSYTKGTLSREAIREALHIMAEQQDRLAALEARLGIETEGGPQAPALAAVPSQDHLTAPTATLSPLEAFQANAKEIAKQIKGQRAALKAGLKVVPAGQRKDVITALKRLEEVQDRVMKLGYPRKANAKIQAK